jgi:hypothetical protein
MEGFVHEEEEAMAPMRPVREGDVSLVSRRESDASWTSVLYMRKHLVDVQNNLDEFLQHEKMSQFVHPWSSRMWQDMFPISLGATRFHFGEQASPHYPVSRKTESPHLD